MTEIIVDYLPENAWQPKIVPTQIIFHTAVDGKGDTDLQNYFEYHSSLESHYWVPFRTPAVRMMDSNVRADANFYANRRLDGTGAISIETEDDGKPEENPWNDKQIEDLLYICNLEIERWDIPRRICPGPNEPGLGYHAMWGAPSLWTPVRGKSCPGSLRIKQFREVIMPALIVPPVTEVRFEHDPAFLFDDLGHPIRSSYSPASGGTYHVCEEGHVLAVNCPYRGAPSGQDYWGDRKAARISASSHSANTYMVTATNGQTYNY